MSIQRFLSALVLALVLTPALASSASASPISIGTFWWDDDIFAGGSIFQIANSSDFPYASDPADLDGYVPSTFDDVVLSVFGAADDVLATYQIGLVDVGTTWNSLSDPQFVPFLAAARAVLTLTFNGTTLLAELGDCASPDAEGCLSYVDDDFGTPSFRTAARSLIVDVPPLATVPEPATLMLVGSGVAGLWLRRRRLPLAG